MVLYTYQENVDKFFARTPSDIIAAVRVYRETPELSHSLLERPPTRKGRKWLREGIAEAQTQPVPDASLYYNQSMEIDVIEFEKPDGTFNTMENPNSYADLRLASDISLRVTYNTFPWLMELRKSIDQAKRGPLYEILRDCGFYKIVTLIPEDAMRALQRLDLNKHITARNEYLARHESAEA